MFRRSRQAAKTSPFVAPPIFPSRVEQIVRQGCQQSVESVTPFRISTRATPGRVAASLALFRLARGQSPHADREGIPQVREQVVAKATKTWGFVARLRSTMQAGGTRGGTPPFGGVVPIDSTGSPPIGTCILVTAAFSSMGRRIADAIAKRGGGGSHRSRSAPADVTAVESLRRRGWVGSAAHSPVDA